MNQIQITTKDEFRTFAEQFEIYIYSFFNMDPPGPEDKIDIGDELASALNLVDKTEDRVGTNYGILNYNVFSYSHPEKAEIPCYFDFDISYDPHTDQMIIELASIGIDSTFQRNRGIGTKFLQHFVDFFKKNKFTYTDVELRIHPSGFGSFMLYVKHGFNIHFDSDSELIIFLQLLVDNGIDSAEHFLFNQNSDTYNLRENYTAWRTWMDSQLTSGTLIKQYFNSGE